MTTLADRVSILLTGTELEELLDLAGVVDREGFRRVWIAETGGLDAASVGAVIARTTSLEVGTAIVSVFSRTPVLLSMMAGTWSRLGGGQRKVYLGIGAGGQHIVEQWHGADFEKPATTTRDTLRIIRQALSGERTSYLGKARHSEGYQSPIGPSPEVKIYVGGMGPAMIAMAAEEADGLILTWISPRVLRGIRDDFVDQVARAGRAPNEVRLVARAYVAITDRPEIAREEVRKELVEYLLSPPYGRYFGSIGFQREVDEVNAAYRERNRAGAVAAVSDGLLDEVFIGGTTGAQVVERLSEYLDAGADEVIVQPVTAVRGGDPSGTIKEVAAAFRDAPFE